MHIKLCGRDLFFCTAPNLVVALMLYLLFNRNGLMSLTQQHV